MRLALAILLCAATVAVARPRGTWLIGGEKATWALNDLNATAGTSVLSNAGTIAATFVDARVATGSHHLSNSWFEASNPTTLTNTIGSVAFWFKSTNDAVQCVFGLAKIGSSPIEYLFVFAGNGGTGEIANELFTVARVTSTGTKQICGPTNAVRTVIFDGNWHHVAIVWPGDGGTTLYCYIDGSPANMQYSATSTVDNYFSVLNCSFAALGVRKYQTQPYSLPLIRGSLDEVRIYSTALTESQVKVLYQMGR